MSIAYRLWPLFLLLSVVGANAQPLPVDVRLEPAEITVGDRVRVELMLVWNGSEPAAAPRFPDWKDGWGDAEVLKAGPVEAIAGPRRIYRQDLELTAFRPGEVLLPELAVEVPLAGETLVRVPIPAASLMVRAILPAGSELTQPRPAADPAALPGGLSAPDQRAFAVVTLVQAVLCALALLFHRRRRAAVATTTEEPIRTPIEVFDLRLSELDADICEEAHFGLSLALRAFLGERLRFPALESTTREMPARLRREEVPKAAADTLGRLLQECDQVKFAKRMVNGELTRERLVEARKAAREVERHVRRGEIEAEANSSSSASVD